MKSYHEFIRKNDQIEKEYLEKYLPLFEKSVHDNFFLLSSSKELLKESRKILNFGKADEAKRTIESLSPAQRTYYGYLLKLYNHGTAFYTTYDIIHNFGLRPNARSAIQRYFDTNQRDSKNQRGVESISEILEVKQIKNNKNHLNTYRPKGFPKIFAELHISICIGLVLKVNNTDLLSSHYKKLVEFSKQQSILINGMEEILRNTMVRLSEVNSNKSEVYRLRRVWEQHGGQIRNIELEIWNHYNAIKNIKERSADYPEMIRLQKECFEYDIKKTFENSNSSSLLDESLAFKSTLTITIDFFKAELHFLEHILFAMKFRKAMLQYRQRITLDKKDLQNKEQDPRWRYDGIEPFLVLKNELDVDLHRDVIDEKIHQDRIQLLKNELDKIVRLPFRV